MPPLFSLQVYQCNSFVDEVKIVVHGNILKSFARTIKGKNYRDEREGEMRGIEIVVETRYIFYDTWVTNENDEIRLTTRKILRARNRIHSPAFKIFWMEFDHFVFQEILDQ